MKAAAGGNQLRRAILASLAGNMLEWYDFFLFGTAAALVFNRLFFPAADPTAALLAAFSVYAVGFAARPIGGLIFGHVGDRHGRKVSLVWTLSIMGVATFAIGLLPSYEQAGMLAPALLVALRLLQGIAAGGEWGGGVLMITENAPADRRGFLGAWSQVGVGLGFVLASLAFFLARRMPEADFLAWGWRLPFLASILIFLVGVFIRLRISETARHLEEGRGSHAAPILRLLRRYPRAILTGVGIRLAENGGSHLLITFSLAYGVTVGAPADALLVGVMLGMIADSAMMPVFGALSDRIGRRAVYLAGVIGLALFGYPFLRMLDSGAPAMIVAAFVIGNGLCHAAMIGVQPALFSEMFDGEVRYSGLAFVHEVSSVIVGFAPLIATALYASSKSPVPVAAYLAILCLLSAVALLSWRGGKEDFSS
ncbi:MFS transporter [Rhizorhabdus histidinilytica]|uniref:Predicted arabinose efflux permease, MFS family n=1 Tax=Rhizorhabdus histidinilytica TaxID=439228 RepID=A0A1T4ZUB0_9SPHN|nr:MFS transporter [Rhizorhabdus histidinilytica]SKB26195.1 Predicted arabinose efflux permease, MFS family [Rhizorhabdus histidinilytica]